MLTVHHSNDLQGLARELAALTAKPLPSAFDSEIVVVQSRGIARWLSLALADRNGVCANVRFPFPTAFAWELSRAVCGDLPELSVFDPEILTWRIVGALPELEGSPAFSAVKAYVSGDPLRRLELAERLARLYDEYLVFRPDWIFAWEREKPQHWQAQLWQRLVKDADVPHRAALHARVVKALAAQRLSARVPARVSIFGAPSLPPMLLELFSALGRHTEVHLVIQNPCREYWADIVDEGRIARRHLERQADARYLESGNTLLASLGKQGGDFIDLLTSVEGSNIRESDCFVEPGGDTLLASIQSDILNLREPKAGAATCVISRTDRSLQIHSCHGAMREVEVLHDQLLALFSSSPDLEPSDVVVMTPDIETYAPYVEAVFATATPRIPFNISDRSSEKESTLAATFMALLDFRGSRYEASRVLGILDEVSVCRRFGLGEGDLESVRRWVRESHIRWGIDGAHRASFGLPATHEHTWRFGLDRLLLGYALPGGEERLFSGVLPYDDVEGSLGIALGRFTRFVEAAIALNDELAGARTIAQWSARLNAVIATFFDTADDRAEELSALRNAIASIEKSAAIAAFSGAVPLAVIVAALRARLEVPGRAFLSGGVTFCAMVPMRSLPFEVVCMVGMNDGAYPRIRRRDGFDLMANDFRKGDRSRRDDDRYLFLESLVNARRCLYMSYTGRHIREDTVMPPSVLVSELLDYVERGYRTENGEPIRVQLVTEHPLQAFSRRYFEGGEKLFSYSSELASAASVAGHGKRQVEAFLSADLPSAPAESRVIDIETLVRFFRNPARYLLQSRLNIRLESAAEELDSREPFELEGLPFYLLKERLLDMRLRGEPHERLDLARASGVLPHGRMGEVLFEEQSRVVARVAEAACQRMAERRERLPFEISSANVTVSGTLGPLDADGMLVYRAAQANASVRVNAWIRHLALNACAPAGSGRTSRCVAQDCVLTFAPVDDARERLRELLELYWSGLHRPLHFFPRAACEYAKYSDINYKVRAVWEGSYDRRGERDDLYFALAFRGLDPLDAEFEALAQTVFGGMAVALKEEPVA